MTEPSFDDDIRTYVELDAQRADIQGRLDEIKERLRTYGVGKHDGPNGVVVTITPNRRFDAGKAIEVVPEALIPLIQSTVVDPKLARQKLPPETYDQCKVEVGDYRVSVR